MTHLLSAKGLRLAFGGLKAADGIDLDVEAGEFLAIIGPNGAGKTTFINMTTGYLKPQGGSIAFEGQPILGLSPRRIVGLGVVRSFQLPQLFAEHTVLQNVALAVASRSGTLPLFAPLLRPGIRDEAADLIERFGLSDLAGVRADALNEGTRKLVDIAMAVALRPRLIMMDEPTSGVAAAEKMGIVETLVRVLRGAGVTAVFVEHDMEVVGRFADRVAVWGQGRIAALGPPQVILNDPEVQRTVIGIVPAGGGHAPA
ncbi:ABC transporter ATP-binding protein [Methylobacterium sp. WSM2598]|uniref:ABC transporter ATP-binding protein n=1 Tax=Methylobacterium sp. WSM2598 TaxID=398261 RepID=UPI000361B9C5|nr:ABC transporter ATP-binding protein [Methylobacterium sp. WSM2598]